MSQEYATQPGEGVKLCKEFRLSIFVLVQNGNSTAMGISQLVTKVANEARFTTMDMPIIGIA